MAFIYENGGATAGGGEALYLCLIHPGRDLWGSDDDIITQIFGISSVSASQKPYDGFSATVSAEILLSANDVKQVM